VKKNYFKSFYFYFSLFIFVAFIPLLFYLEAHRGSYPIGFMAKVSSMLQRIENQLVDTKFRMTPNKVGDKRVIVVAIDEHSLEKLGRWQSWGRDFYAKTIASLDMNGAKVIGFDVVFDSPDENPGFLYLKQLSEQYNSFHQKGANNDYLEALKNATSFANTDWMLEQAARTFNEDKSKGVVYGYFVETKPGKYVEQKMKDMPADLKILMRSMIITKKENREDELPFELDKKVDDYGINFDEIAKSSNYHGYFSMNPDSDGVVRNYRLLMRMYGQVYPSLGLKMIERYWGESPILRQFAGSLYLEFNKREFHLPLFPNGAIPLNYYGTQNSFITVSLADLIDENEEISYAYNHSRTAKFKARKDELFKDSLVLVGATAIGIFDVRNTPKQVNLPGVEVHATILSQFLKGDFFKTNDMSHLYQVSGLTLVMILILGFIIFKFGAVFSLVAVTAFLLGAFYYDLNMLFKKQILVFLTPTYFALFVQYLILNVYKFLTEEKEKNRIKNTFKQYVSPEVVQQMIEDPEAIKMGGESKTMSVLFTDIEGFTTISESLQPEQLSHLLNIYLTEMTHIIFENGGTLDKFIGDAIMCFWNAPVGVEEHEFLACKTAIEMQKANRKLNEKFKKEYGIILNTRIGINTGQMAVGNMGSETQFAYTVLGDSVNLAARLESINKQYGSNIIISQNTYEAVKDSFYMKKLDKVAVKGKAEPVTIYQLLGNFDDLNDLELKKRELFQKALELYFTANFSQAMDIFNSPELANDLAAKLFVDRCQAF
jgi:adenylate cyclase